MLIILLRAQLSRTLLALLFALSLGGLATPVAAERILFVGNSFTFGAGSPVKTYRPDLVRDLNGEGVGGVPALFKRFAEQAGQNWEVSLETASGRDFAYHLANKRGQLTGAWDVVVLQDYSTLDKARPGDPASHVRDAVRLANLFKVANPRVRVWLETTWSRADLTYPAGAPYRGKPIRALTDDVARANALAIAEARELFAGTAPVGEAWLRAMRQGVADPNPYDGIAFGKTNLWTWDHYHASTAGYYLAALVIFGRVTGVDPRSLGGREKAADALGLNPATVVALQKIAAEELSGNGNAAAARSRDGQSSLNPRRTAPSPTANAVIPPA